MNTLVGHNSPYLIRATLNEHATGSQMRRNVVSKCIFGDNIYWGQEKDDVKRTYSLQSVFWTWGGILIDCTFGNSGDEGRTSTLRSKESNRQHTLVITL